MAITSLAQYNSAYHETYDLTKGSGGSELGNGILFTAHSIFAAGTGGSLVLPNAAGAVENVSRTQGIVPVGGTTTGFMKIKSPNGGSLYPTGMVIDNRNHASAGNPIGYHKLYDVVFYSGEYQYNDTVLVSLASQPDYSSRLRTTPTGGVNYNECELVLLGSTPNGPWDGSVSHTITVTYTDGGGTGGRTALFRTPVTGSSASSHLIQGEFESGVSGVQKVDSVICQSGISGGAFCVGVIRNLGAFVSVPIYATGSTLFMASPMDKLSRGDVGYLGPLLMSSVHQDFALMWTHRMVGTGSFKDTQGIVYMTVANG